MNVLIVEDEVVVALDIADILERHIRARTVVATTFEEAKNSIETFRPNIALLDINLREGFSGIDVAEYIKNRMEIPVIFLTAYSDTETVEKALRVKPDGYLVKPFKEEELIAMTKLHFYKWRERHSSVVVFDKEFSFDLEKEELRRAGEIVTLTQKERAFLALLSKNVNTVVSTEAVDHLLWPDDVIHDNTRRNFVYRLRKKLDDRFLKTVYGVGYSLEI
jgi:DNA-binding response OmpR family regulator